MKRGIKRERFERLLRKAKLCNRFPNVSALISLAFYCEVPVSHVVGDVKYRQVGAISVGERVHGISKDDVLVGNKDIEISVSNNHGKHNVVIGRNDLGAEEIVKVYKRTRRGRLFKISRSDAYRMIKEVENITVPFPVASRIKVKAQGHRRSWTRGVEMKNKNGKDMSAKKAEKKTVKEEKIEEEKILCKDCRHLDTRTIRDFARHGIRQGLIERRGKCTNEKVKARGHLVRIDMPKKCTGFEEGQFVVPEKKKKVKKKEVVKKTGEKTVEPIEESDEEKTTPSEYHGPPLTDIEKKDLKDNNAKVSKKNSAKDVATKQVTKVDERKIKKVVTKNPRNGETVNFVKQKRNGRVVLVKQ
jgi:hypothetical protein